MNLVKNLIGWYLFVVFVVLWVRKYYVGFVIFVVGFVNVGMFNDRRKIIEIL